MAQNTNFKGNKNNNQKKKLPYIKVKIDKIISLEESKTKAFASVTIGGAVVVHGVRIMNSAKGLFVAMPANVYVDDNGEKHFNEIAHPVSKEARTLLNNKIMEAYHQSLTNSRQNQKLRICRKMNRKTFCRVCSKILWTFQNLWIYLLLKGRR